MKKKTILGLTAICVFMICKTNRFAQSDRKAEKARNEIKEAENDLKVAKNGSAAYFLKFRNDSELAIKEYENRINEQKNMKFENNKKEQEKYDRKVLYLVVRNNKLKKQVRGSESIKISNSSSFKREFSHDLGEFGNTFKDADTNNEK
jgi:hypothetical protein